MEALQTVVITRSFLVKATYESAFEYLADPMNQPKWAIHFVQRVEQTADGYLATLPFGQLPIQIHADPQTGVLDIQFGEGSASPVRLVSISPGECLFSFTLVKPTDMPDPVWEQQAVPNLEEELEMLKTQLMAL
ncbi:hypothetical protein [Pontibacter sp. G13]|uniref:hypothetical protein n=1 Tax=Pontibacter sp. G13 TaxID=3074898 RepID=UPI0028891FB2|nr:hypothetical protein [Pontibacter sp. G13]WNJ17752.1 hypothetical protein RJD25_23110 [Pontibacter sp. G13]